MYYDVEIKLKKGNKILFSRDGECLQEGSCVNFVYPELRETARILDIGCETGAQTMVLAKNTNNSYRCASRVFK
ncbi:hypothetical protein [Schnuerera sp.]|uniref:hypothetical protein n=1 Tax=Schnuerera sp. TaxID=2794844 RepID=UPI002BE1CEA3|nr:hypothetical protein [Schnuerera sp.]HSH36915.1 hypothetical protein [Schnuerera sp.]